ncbi:MAG TPA: PQQ-binding-like beta-propeller repeat protein [Pirellulales bacterium]|jgi:outer membrane protein assembly factor BamB|nr:PQQ-binding-like beta-propeller repeat protein [Pirellulales bacterium]
MRQLSTFILTLALAQTAAADDWPQWMGPARDAVWAETGVVERLPPEGPKVLWRKEVGGGYAGPAVAGGKVYLADYVKSAGDDTPNPIKRNELEGRERVVCFDAADGNVLWTQAYDCPYTISYPAGPRCTPTMHHGKVYTLGAMGNLLCLDAQKGTVLWSKDFTMDYGVKAPLWGFCGHPLIDGQQLFAIVGGEGTAAVAFDKDTGEELWRSLSSKETGYSAPALIEAGGVRQLLIWHGEALNALNPETGELYWTFPLAPRMGMAIMVPRVDGEYLFAGAVYGTAVGLKLASDKPAVSLAWRGPANMKDSGLFPMNMTPFAEGGVVYGVDQPGQFRAMKIDTGERLWESWLPVTGESESRPVYTGTAFVVKNGGRFFLFNEKGELVIAKLSPAGYEEVSRWKALEPTSSAFGRDVVWSHPAFANRSMYARNDKELVCVSLAAE